METNLQLKSPSFIIVSGGSNCGKTFLVEKLLTNHSECFEKQFEEIHWVYSTHAKDLTLFQRLEKLDVPVQFHEGYPDQKIKEKNLFSKSNDAHKCLVLDDIFTEPKACTTLFDMVNVMSHHSNITCILIVQNLSGANVSQKGCLSTLLRSTTYLVLFVNRRTVPIIRYIAKNYFPGEGHKVVEPFNYILKSKQPHSYLLLDFSTEEEITQVREGGLLIDEKCYGFKFA